MSSAIQTSRLADICALVTDGTHDSPKLLAHGVPFIKGKHISGGIIDFENCDFISEADHLKVIARSKPELGDTLFSNIGSVGDAAFVSTTREFSIKNVALFKPDRNKVDPRYLFYLLRSHDVVQGLLAHRSGSAQPFIGLSTLRAFEVAHHRDLSTQQRISAILSAYDDLIENNTRRIAILEEMARRLYEEWFVHFRFPAAGATSISAARLLDLADVAYGKGLPSKNLINDGDYPVYGAAKIIGRYSIFTESDRTIIAGCRGSVGRFTITEPMCFVTNNSFTFKPKEPLDFFWLYFALSDRGLADVVSGSAQPQITLASLSNVELPRPPAADRERFANLVRPWMEAIWNHHERNNNLRAQRDLLLPKLVSGEINVSRAQAALEAAE